ncbi:hypothetical protein [Streptomyces sp. SID13031]|uniref:hypothetical protein n=1 Tax=Streptomyces sp. SID13031 TaxID=2706046 RepID=UPI0013CB4B65|nr:hypothetical protein [Streptomyces sp. SID13031]NEA32378.1 hypothetical protein [Streptomyces sp. SID13031]
MHKWAQVMEDEVRAMDLAAGFEFVAQAQHNLLNPGGRATHISSRWLRHLRCGQIVPRRQRYRLDNKTGEVAPPQCMNCGDEPWRPSTAIKPTARDLLYLVRFEARGVRFLKIGRTLAGLDRLPSHLRLGAQVLQVVESTYDKVQPAERNIIRAMADYRMTTHPFTEHFTTAETFRLGARPIIGDLATWVGRGTRDRTTEWVQRYSR